MPESKVVTKVDRGALAAATIPADGGGNATVVKPPKKKEKRRNNEKRKEKSRDAARCRRSRETEIFTDLANVLPARQEDVEQLDKASIMRLAIAYLKVRTMMELFSDEITGKKSPGDLVTPKSEFTLDEDTFVQAIDGFLMVLSADGDVTYVSENVAEYLGILQIDMIGQQVWEYSHQCDHSDLRDVLLGRRDDVRETGSDGTASTHRDLLLRFKCTLTPRGRNVNIKSASYKVVQLSGHMAVDSKSGQRQFVAVARPLPHPANIEVPLDSSTFLTKHTMDMRFSYVDDKMKNLLGYEPEDLQDKSLYDFHHAGDSGSLLGAFKSAISKGQAETYRYRFLARTGGYCWVVTQATIVYEKQKPQSIVCVNYVISGVEHEHEIYSCAQLEASRHNNRHNALDSQPLSSDKHSTLNNCPAANGASITPSDSAAISATIPATVGQPNSTSNKENINSHNSENAHQKPFASAPEPLPIPSVLLKTALPAKNNRVLPRPRSVTASVFSVQSPSLGHKPTSADHGPADPPKAASRPQSVTAQLFQSVEPADTANSEQTLVVAGVPASPVVVARPHSVTAQVFASDCGADQQQSAVAASPLLSKATSADAMNKNYLMYLDDGTDLNNMLKEEPDDALSHLTNADVCITLDETAPLFGEMFDNLILPDSYGTLLADDIVGTSDALTASDKSTLSTDSSVIDPFMSYREESSCDTIGTPNQLSPVGYPKSPNGGSIPSLCSPSSLSHDDEFAFMTMNCDDGIDLSMRAPYIPMNENDDLPLITDDLMWSAFSDEFGLHKDVSDVNQQQQQQRDTNQLVSLLSNMAPASATAIVMSALHAQHPNTMQAIQRAQCQTELYASGKDCPKLSDYGKLDDLLMRTDASDASDDNELHCTVDEVMEHMYAKGNNHQPGMSNTIQNRSSLSSSNASSAPSSVASSLPSSPNTCDSRSVNFITSDDSVSEWTMDDLLAMSPPMVDLHDLTDAPLDRKYAPSINASDLLSINAQPKSVKHGESAPSAVQRPLCKRPLSKTSDADASSACGQSSGGVSLSSPSPSSVHSAQSSTCSKRAKGECSALPSARQPSLTRSTNAFFAQQKQQPKTPAAVEKSTPTALLQQLMANPNGSAQRPSAKSGAQARLSFGRGDSQPQQQQSGAQLATAIVQPVSNSVLKNLLPSDVPPDDGIFAQRRMPNMFASQPGAFEASALLQLDAKAPRRRCDAPDIIGEAFASIDARSGAASASKHIRYEPVPMLIGAHDDDDGGGGGRQSDRRFCRVSDAAAAQPFDVSAAVPNASIDMEFIMSDFNELCAAGELPEPTDDDDRTKRAATSRILACMDEPLPQVLQTLLMELEGGEPDLDALIAGDRVARSDGAWPLAGTTADGELMLPDELDACWTD